jgi:hypothetical protein
MLCEQKKNLRDKIWNLLTQQIRTAFLLALLSLSITKKKKIKTEANNSLRFPIRLKIVLGSNGNYGNTLKLKTTAKLNSKQTSIATVQDLYQMYATLLTPLGSHYRLLKA